MHAVYTHPKTGGSRGRCVFPSFGEQSSFSLSFLGRVSSFNFNGASAETAKRQSRVCFRTERARKTVCGCESAEREARDTRHERERKPRRNAETRERQTSMHRYTWISSTLRCYRSHLGGARLPRVRRQKRKRSDTEKAKARKWNCVKSQGQKSRRFPALASAREAAGLVQRHERERRWVLGTEPSSLREGGKVGNFTFAEH